MDIIRRRCGEKGDGQEVVVASRIAVVGAGAAGLMSAWLLQDEGSVVVFEAAPRPGGHIHTVTVESDGVDVPVELGAEFVFEEGYGGLLALIDRLRLTRRTERMAASMTLPDGRTLQVPPRTAMAVRRCLPPATLRTLYWMRALAAAAEVVADQRDWTLTVQALVERARIPRDVADTVLIPLVAASWGVTTEQARGLAAYSVVRVMGLRLRHTPHAVALDGGLGTYIHALVADSPRVELRLGTPVERVDRGEEGLVVSAGGRAEPFDAVVLACDWHNSAALCRRSPALEPWHRAFAAFEDYPARLAVHRDLSRMPAERALWGVANYDFAAGKKPRNTVWSGLRARRDVFRTWLRDDEALPLTTTCTADYRHIVITPEHPARQRRLAALQGNAGVFAAGMYTDGIDNHESALRSALRVAERVAPRAERVRWFATRVSPE